MQPLEEEPTSSGVVVSRRDRDRVRRYSTPPIRDCGVYRLSLGKPRWERDSGGGGSGWKEG